MNESPDQERRISIVLDRLRSAHNVGNIFRIAEAVGAAEVICCGYTPAPPHPKLEKTAMGTDKTVPSRCFESSLEALRALRAEGYAMILAVESLDGLSSPDAWNFEYRFPLALVFGNEALGIAAETMASVDGTVSLPMFGRKSSINVGNCAAVVLYAVIAQGRRIAARPC